MIKELNPKLCFYSPPYPRVKSYFDMIDVASEYNMKAVEMINFFEFENPDKEMAKKLIEHGYFLDILLCESAGALHDIKRLEKMHAESGAEYLKSLGYDAVSDIVQCHMTSENLPLDFDERTIVFLADKLMREREFVTPDVRYAPALEKFPKDSEVGSRIRKDLEFSKILYKKYIDLTGDMI